MPHSSGGGSHGGGSHSSSFHSSSGSSSGSSGPTRQTSAKPFPGAARYYYYNRAGHLGYFYSNMNPRQEYAKVSPVRSTIFTAILGIPLGLLFLLMVFSAYGTPSRLSTGESAVIEIQDRAELLTESEETRLQNLLRDFFAQTGITPGVVTGWNEDWKPNYSSLENYAYDLYVNSYPDETHWLLVYTTGRDGGEFDEWYWEGMQGDDTDSILSETVVDQFTQELQRDLTARSRYTVGEAFIQSFAALNSGVMKARMDWELLIVGAVGLLIVCLYSFFHLKNVYTVSQYKTAGRCPSKVVEDSCAYCGCAYVVGTVSACPHCGAPIPAHNE